MQVGRGELDLVVSLEGRTVAVEVRTVTGEEPLDAFDSAKLRQVRKLAASIRADRVDLVGIRLADQVELRWVKGV